MICITILFQQEYLHTKALVSRQEIFFLLGTEEPIPVLHQLHHLIIACLLDDQWPSRGARGEKFRQTLEEEDESEEQENQVPTNILLELGNVNIPMLVIEDIIEEEEQVQQH